MIKLLKLITSELALIFIGSLLLSTLAIAQDVSTKIESRNRLQDEDSKSLRAQKLMGSWNLKMSQRQEKDSFNQKSINEFKLGLNLKYFPFESAYFDFSPNFKYRNGFEQTQNNSENTQNQLGVREASFNLSYKKSNSKNNPKDFLFLASFGALDQSIHRPKMLFYEQTFAGIQTTTRLQSFQAQAEYAIPTTNSLSTQTQDFEKTPEFNSLSLEYSVGDDVPAAIFRGNYHLGSFQFSHLPGKIATQSGLNGNTTLPTAGRDSEFKYEYSGFYLASDSQVKIYKSHYLGLELNYLINDRVEGDIGHGLDETFYWKWSWNKNLSLKPFYQYFRIGSDAAVAAYNNPFYGTNRQGYRLGFGFQYKENLSFSASYGEKDALVESPYILKDNFIFLTLETADVEI